MVSVNELLETLKEGDSRACALTVVGLCIMGSEAEASVPELMQGLIPALTDPRWKVRTSAAVALGALGPAAADAIPALLEALKDYSTAVRAATAWALGALGPTAEAAIPALIVRLKDLSSRVRAQAAWALGRMGQAATDAVLKDAVLALIGAFRRDADPDVQGAAEAALRAILDSIDN